MLYLCSSDNCVEHIVKLNVLIIVKIKKKHNMKKLITLLCGLLLTASLFAQTRYAQAHEVPHFSHWSIFVKGGLAVFDGDVLQKYNEVFATADKNFGLGAGVEYSFNPRWGLAFEYNYIKYGADVSNLAFEGNMHLPSVLLSANLSNLFYNHRKRYKWNVYLNVGFGVGFYDVESTRVPDHPVSIAHPNGPRIQPHRIKNGRAGAAIGGLNIEYNFSKSFAVAWSNQYRMFNKDNLEAADFQWGNMNDAIFTTMLGLRYKFNPNKDYHTRNIDFATFDELRDPSPASNDDLLKRLDDMDNRLAAVEERPIPNIDKLQKQVDDLEALVQEHLKRAPVEDKEPGAYTNFHGVPIPSEMAAVIPSIFFDFNSAELDQRSLGIIKEVALRMIQIPDSRIEIRAYTDKPGSEEYNLRLSLRRALAAKNQLVNVHKINPDRIIVNGLGRIPEPATRFQLNRRADFFFDK